MINTYRPARKLCQSGRYAYVNPYGGEHAVLIKQKGEKTYVVFDDGSFLDRELLKGKFYYRK